mmetsp:Transcript_23015/g.60114  ORF Transcript_23015/g.60114 Transcript_23015/m.60114 type:complete len:126 (-) Transcript_23015:1114-1491(-)
MPPPEKAEAGATADVTETADATAWQQMQEARRLEQQATYMLTGLEYQMKEQIKQVDACAETLGRGADAAATKQLGTAGNAVMKLLEKLDQVSVPQGAESVRAKRRELVKMGNKTLDIAEKHGFKI